MRLYVPLQLGCGPPGVSASLSIGSKSEGVVIRLRPRRRLRVVRSAPRYFKQIIRARESGVTAIAKGPMFASTIFADINWDGKWGRAATEEQWRAFVISRASSNRGPPGNHALAIVQSTVTAGAPLVSYNLAICDDLAAIGPVGQAIVRRNLWCVQQQR